MATTFVLTMTIPLQYAVVAVIVISVVLFVAEGGPGAVAEVTPDSRGSVEVLRLRARRTSAAPPSPPYG